MKYFVLDDIRRSLRKWNSISQNYKRKNEFEQNRFSFSGKGDVAEYTNQESCEKCR